MRNPVRWISALAIVVAACGGDTATCSTVNGADFFGVEDGNVLGPDETLGVVESSDAWIVATAGGAAWVTFTDPATDEGSLILPLNDQARAVSEFGIDVAADAPIFEGWTDAAPEIGDAAACAS